MVVRLYTIRSRRIQFSSFNNEQIEEIKKFLIDDIPNRAGMEYIAYYDDYILADESEDMPPEVIEFLARLIEENGGSVNITFATKQVVYPTRSKIVQERAH